MCCPLHASSEKDFSLGLGMRLGKHTIYKCICELETELLTKTALYMLHKNLVFRPVRW